VGIRLSDNEKAIARIHFAALIAPDNAGRDAGTAHQHDEGRRIVFAETAARAEQEVIDAVLAQ
jgi:hypothetical protein